MTSRSRNPPHPTQTDGDGKAEKLLTQHGQLDGGPHGHVRRESLVPRLARVLRVVVIWTWLQFQARRGREPLGRRLLHSVLAFLCN